MKLQTVAAMDVGSNAIRCLISDVTELGPDKPVKKSAYLRIPVRLGADVFTSGRISDARQHLFLEAMTAFVHLMRAYDVDHYRICATSAMRDAANGPALISSVSRATGLEISIISGVEEAEILFEANTFSAWTEPDETALYVDVGGGSTEIIAVKNNTLLEAQSFQVGTLRMLAQVVAPEEWLRLDVHLARMAETYKPRQIIASGGNINKAAKLLDKKEGKATSRAELQALYENLRNLPYGERLSDQEELAAFYPQLGAALKRKFAGWTCHLLTADLRLPKLMRLTPGRKTPLFNGAIECRLFEFAMVAGSNRNADRPR